MRKRQVKEVGNLLQITQGVESRLKRHPSLISLSYSKSKIKKLPPLPPKIIPSLPGPLVHPAVSVFPLKAEVTLPQMGTPLLNVGFCHVLGNS